MNSKVINLDIDKNLIRFEKVNGEDYFCISDIADRKGGESRIHVQNWMRARNTISFLGYWEQMHNKNFNCIEFDAIKKEQGNNSFTMSPDKWSSQTNAIGIYSKKGKNGGVYAHSDIALEFATWIDPLFKILLLKEYQNLKASENKQIEWQQHRLLAKVNNRIHTDAIKEKIIPQIQLFSKQQESYVYANENDMLNKIVFGTTAKEWREQHNELVESKNMRDYGTKEQNLVIANLEFYNARMIRDGLNVQERAKKLAEEAIILFKSFLQISNNDDKIEDKHNKIENKQS
ncbi:MAG: KilA-N domain-containing protein [Rickettsiales bacterium]|nr:KilA-N domain-containing protein [Rickettsiales bacterium]